MLSYYLIFHMNGDKSNYIHHIEKVYAEEKVIVELIINEIIENGKQTITDLIPWVFGGK